MNCPKCGRDTFIRGNRFDKEENEIFRIRMCKSCGNKFHTVEFEIEENETFKEIWKRLLKEYNEELRERNKGGLK